MSAAAQAVRARAAPETRRAPETSRALAEAQTRPMGSPRYLQASVRLGGLHDQEEHEADHAASVIAAGGRYQVRDPGGSCHLRATGSASMTSDVQRKEAAGVRAAVTPPVKDLGADGRIKSAPISQQPVTQPVIGTRVVDVGASGRIRSAPIAPSDATVHRAVGETGAEGQVRRTTAPVADPGGAAHLRAMQAPAAVRSAAAEVPHVARGLADAQAAARIERARSAAARPLPATVRARLEHGFGEAMDTVQLHTGPEARAAARAIGARAYTEGERVTLGHGESEHDIRLMAHEATHVVQNRRAAGIVWPLASPAPEATKRDAAPAAKAEQGPVRPVIRRSILSDALDWIADKANFIPGFRLFTIIIGVNPINMEKVERSGANILRAAVDFLPPAGDLLVRALDQYGAFDKAGAFVDQQIKSLAMTGAAIRDAFMAFIDSLSWTDVFHPGDVWDRAKRIFTDPIDRIKSFFVGLAKAIIQFVKDAVLKPLAALAAKTPAWDILVGVLGKNPITHEEAPPAGEALIGGILKLAHQDEIYENMKKAKALSRIGAWFKGVVSQLLAFVLEIPSLFINALKSFKISDLLDLPGAFGRVVGIFGSFVVKFVSWVGNAIWTMLEIIFDVVSPQALTYIKKTGAALKSILKNPLPFVGNLVKAAKLGFTNFADNIIDHLKAGLIDWLTGSLPGVYIPKALSLVEFGKFALSVLGLSWAQIRGKIVKALGPTGETIMKALETTFDIVVRLVQGGVTAAWELIKEKLTDLKDTVIDGIIGFVKDAIITKAVPKLISMFIPGAGFISAIISIYDTIKVFIEKLSKIAQVVVAFVDSIVAIAAGQIAGAAKRVETSLAGLLSLAISFLAGFVGLGGVADKIKDVITKVQAAVDKALETAVNWIVGKAKALFGFIAQAGVPNDPGERLKLGRQAAIAAVKRFAGQRIGVAVLGPLLSAIKVRYGFQRLEAVPRQGKWAVSGQVNPDFDDVTEALTPEALVSSSDEQTLLLGEGNFSFALSIALKTKLGNQIVATDYSVSDRAPLKTASERTAEAERAALVTKNISQLQSLGVEIDREVNALDPVQYPSGEFENIVFNHPFAVTKDDKGRNMLGGEGANRDLIRGFVTAAREKLKSGGQIIIISSRFRLSRWRLDKMAESLGLDLVLKSFSPQDFEGYRHEKTLRGESAATVVTEEQYAVILTVKGAAQNG